MERALAARTRVRARGGRSEDKRQAVDESSSSELTRDELAAHLARDLAPSGPLDAEDEARAPDVVGHAEGRRHSAKRLHDTDELIVSLLKAVPPFERIATDKLHELRTRARLRLFPRSAHTSPRHALAVSPDTRSAGALSPLPARAS